MFKGARAFNGDLSGWDVSAVTDMGSMFFNTWLFNGDLSGWDVRAVASMNSMFLDAVAYRPVRAFGSRLPPPPPPLTDATICNAVGEALAAGGPEYVHPDYGPIA